MRTLDGQSIPNIITTDPDYPHGRVQDESSPGAGDGTPITELAGIADIYQGVIEQMRLAGVVPDETPEKKEASQIVEAFGWYAPVAVIRVGVTADNLTPRVLGGKYQNGYTATFVYGSFDNTSKYATFKLSVLKGGAASATEKYLVTLSNCKGANALAGSTDKAGIVLSAYHDVTDTNNWAFLNDTADNVSASAGNVTDAAENDLKYAGMTIIVHRIA